MTYYLEGNKIKFPLYKHNFHNIRTVLIPCLFRPPSIISSIIQAVADEDGEYKVNACDERLGKNHLLSSHAGGAR